jgi:hypothetical protein
LRKVSATGITSQQSLFDDVAVNAFVEELYQRITKEKNGTHTGKRIRLCLFESQYKSRNKKKPKQESLLL